MTLVIRLCCCALLSVTCVLPLRAADPKPASLLNLPFNTAENEDDPHIISSGTGLYYSTPVKEKWEMLLSRRGSGPWGTGKVTDDWIPTAGDDRGIFVMPEGRYPQFAYYSTKKDKKTDNFDIYVLVKQSAKGVFSAPTPMNTLCTKADEMYPWVTADGKSIYFSRKTEDGWRVLVATRKETTLAQGFGEPKMLEELPADFHHVTLTPDGKTMYLQGPLDKKRVGLFVCTFDGKTWSKPEELPINHAEGEVGSLSPCLTRDGKGLYFSSDRPGGKGKLDIWAIQVDQLKKK